MSETLLTTDSLIEIDADVRAPEPAKWVDPELPKVKYVMRTAQTVFKEALDNVLPDLANQFPLDEMRLVVDKQNLSNTGAVQRVQLQFKPTIDKDKEYYLSEDVFLTLQPLTLKEFFMNILGFKEHYEERQIAGVREFIPEGFKEYWDADTQSLHIRVAPVASSFSVTDPKELTLITTLFQGQTFTIQFIDKPLDLAQIFKERHMEIVLS